MMPTTQFLAEQLNIGTVTQVQDILMKRLEGHPTKRRRLVEKLLFDGEASDSFLCAIARATNLPLQTLRERYRENRHMLYRWGWLKFFERTGPHFHVETEGRPSPIFAAGMVWSKVKIIPLPEIDNLESLEDKVNFSSRWLADYVKDAPEGVPAFGRVTGYTLYPDTEHAFAYDIEDHLIGPTEPRHYIPFKLSVSGREIPMDFWNIEINRAG